MDLKVEGGVRGGWMSYHTGDLWSWFVVRVKNNNILVTSIVGGGFGGRGGNKKKEKAPRGGRTPNLEIKSLTLYRLS